MKSIKRELNADKCTGCSSCVVTCPVSEATLKFLGPKLAGPAFERFRLADLPDAEWLGYCSNCKNCDVTCPSGVSVSLLNMEAKGEYCKTHRPPLRDWVLSHGETMSKLAGVVPHFLIKFALTNKIPRLFLDFLGVDKRAPVPVFASEYFYKIFNKSKRLKSDKKVVFYPGCYINVYDPETGLDFIEIMEKAGYEVLLPHGLKCCGLPMIANGFMDNAKNNAVANYNILKQYEAKGIDIVAMCPSCTLTLTEEYDSLFWDVTDKDGRLKIWDSCDFVSHLIDKGELSIKEAGNENIIYHAPCHLRAQGIGLPGFFLLRRVFSSGVTDADAGCCGISGSYGFKKGKYDIGMDIGFKLFRKMKISGADISASECGTCRTQMTHGSGLKALHPLSIIKDFIKI